MSPFEEEKEPVITVSNSEIMMRLVYNATLFFYIGCIVYYFPGDNILSILLFLPLKMFCVCVMIGGIEESLEIDQVILKKKTDEAQYKKHTEFLKKMNEFLGEKEDKNERKD